MVNNIVNSLSQIKKFPKKIKKINYSETSMLSVSLYKYIVVKELNLLLHLKNNLIEVYDSNFNILKTLKTSEEDDIKNFGYNYFVFKNIIYISGFTNKNIILYGYNIDNFELETKLKLDNITGKFNVNMINNTVVISKVENKILFVYYLDIENNFEIIKIIKFEVHDSKVYSSFIKNFTYIYANSILFVLNSDYELIEKFNEKINLIETIITSNDNYFTIIVKDNIMIYDKENILRQTISNFKADAILFSESYLLLVDYNKFVIEILALDQNGIFQEFAKISNIQKFKKVDIVDTTIIISGQTQQTVVLPKRIYDKEKFIGYGYYSSLEYIFSVKNMTPIYLIDNKLSTIRKNKDELFIGFTDMVADMMFEKKEIKLEYEFQNNIDIKLDRDFLLISNDEENKNGMLDKQNSNFIFIDKEKINLYFEGDTGSSIKITIENYNKIITFDDMNILKLSVYDNQSMIEINTQDAIRFIGYNPIKLNNILNYSFNVLSSENDVILSEMFIKNNLSFIPFIKDNNIEAIKSDNFNSSDILIKFNPIYKKLIKFSKIEEFENSTLDHHFNRRYMIKNDKNTIKIFDLFTYSEDTFSKISELKLESLMDVKKILYVNPIVVILSKSKDDFETKLNLIDLKSKTNLPYVISNTANENLTDIFTIYENSLFFVTKTNNENILYIVKIDSINEVDNMKKISIKENVKKIKINGKYLAVLQDNNEIMLYDLNTNNSIISFKDKGLVDFSIFENFFVSIINTEDKNFVYVYMINPNFEIITKKEIDITDVKYCEYYNGTFIVANNSSLIIYNLDTINNLIFIKNISEEFVHFYKNILITKTEKSYKLYQLSPSVIFKENQLNSGILFEEITIKNNKEESDTFNLFLQVGSKSEIKINDNIVKFNKIISNDSIVNLILEIPKNEQVNITSNSLDLKLCSVINTIINEKLPCFLPESNVMTNNGEIMIKNIKENDIVINEKGNEVKVLRVNNWSTSLFTENNIPYILPKDCFDTNYPSKETYISPYHKIMLPNNNFVMVKDINLPFIRRFNNEIDILRHNNIILEKITYYNLILENNSNFIVNNMVVESLDPSNPRIQKN